MRGAVPTSAIPYGLVAERWRVVALSVLAGMLLTSFWSYEFVDSIIGDTVANGLLGHDAKTDPIGGTLAGMAFAFATGLAGTFTACNICIFSGVAYLSADAPAARRYPLLVLIATATGVAAIYGAAVAVAGAGLPQISTQTVNGGEFPVRLLQASIVFVLIGCAFLLWGAAMLDVLPALRSRIARWPWWASPAAFGLLAGCFLIGRPFPLFRKMFEHAVATHDPLYGALVFALQALGNLVLMAGLFLLLAHGTGGRFEYWLRAAPGRAGTVAAASMLCSGAFLVTYWGLRVPSRFGIGWWPAVVW